MQERQMATIRKIDSIEEIPGADAIEAACIGGWKVVVKKGEFQVGSLAVYCEIDSWIPHSLVPFLTKPGQFPKIYNNVEGQRLRTIKLRGQISQGLLLPYNILFDFESYKAMASAPTEMLIDFDVTSILGIQKWEAPAEFRAANAKGNFPWFIPKTDQERIQNLTKEFEAWKQEKVLWQCTEKVDGSSITVYVKDGQYGVCSRNLELKLDDENSWCKLAKSYELIEKIQSTGRNLAFQGEIYGSAINGNLYKLNDQRFMLYNVFDIDEQVYLLPQAVEQLAQELQVPHVPVLEYSKLEASVADMLDRAEGKSTINASSIREGLVFKHTQKHGVSFKAISNSYLLKHE